MVAVKQGCSNDFNSLEKAKRDEMSRALANEADVAPNERHRLYKTIHSYADIFSVDGEMGLTDKIEHHIPTCSAAPVSQPPRRVPFHRLSQVEKFVEDGLQQGLIRHSRSP